MPQMSPLSWLILFIVFCITFILFNVMNYYCIQYPVKTISKEKKITQINWKW
uniref:ATP synthase F0 subunit 8 n=1 Tax=Trichius succinctus TaxID=1310326 RepID=UPI00202897E9|nr:ATP synthase F0 subunit 8 [Trichius succinctus]UQJ77493.1 ATP synthase F0 subunit 8 [Trichius succinctus]